MRATRRCRLANCRSKKCGITAAGALRHADWAAGWMRSTGRRLERVQSGRMESVADELGPLQHLAAALNVRFRAEVAERRF